MKAQAKAAAQKALQKPKRGRPKKGESRPPVPLPRLEQQLYMTIEEMLEDLPMVCDIGTKRNSKGHTNRWKGYKLHLDTADGGIPISAILTSASVHDSQVALPLATITAKRVTNCLVPDCDGIFYNELPSKEELWDKYYTGAPKRQRQCVGQSKIVKRA